MLNSKMKVILNTLLLFVIFSTDLSAQGDWKKDIAEMNKTYMSASSYRMNIEVMSFAKKNDVKPFVIYKGEVAYSGTSFYSQMAGRVTIQNKKCFLVVDKKQKVILYRKNKKEQKIKNDVFSIANLDSALIYMEKSVTVKYLLNTAAEKRIIIEYKGGEIEKIEMVIDPKNNTLAELIYYYRNSENAQMVKIRYSDLNINGTISGSYFSEAAYVTVKNNKVIATSKYQNFEVMDQSELVPTN